jgi:hypothetical protein
MTGRQPRNVGPNTPLRLAVAASLAYPDGSMTASGLRREAKRGRLVIERTAGKDYTTLGHINRMRELCQLEAKDPGCIYDVRAETMKADTHRFGSSSTVKISAARAALHTMLQEPNALSPGISPASTQGQLDNAAAVIPIKSR